MGAARTPFTMTYLEPLGRCAGCGEQVFSKTVLFDRKYLKANGLKVANSADRCESCAAWEKRHPESTIEQRRDKIMGTPKKDIGSTRWISEAACGEADPNLFDEIDSMYGWEHSATFPLAQEWCADCPVIAECLRFAVNNEQTGTRGGRYLVKGEVQVPIRITPALPAEAA